MVNQKKVVATVANGVEILDCDFCVVESDYGVKVCIVSFPDFLDRLHNLSSDEVLGCEGLSDNELKTIKGIYGIKKY